MPEIEELVPIVEQFIPVTLANLQREYPNGLLHQLKSDADVQPPHVLHPIFYGCYDWHSAVHSYWQVARALRLFPDAAFAPAATELFNHAFTTENVAGEMAYLQERPGFELPYGMAWLLQLLAELHEMNTPLSKPCSNRLNSTRLLGFWLISNDCFIQSAPVYITKRHLP